MNNEQSLHRANYLDTAGAKRLSEMNIDIPVDAAADGHHKAFELITDQAKVLGYLARADILDELRQQNLLAVEHPGHPAMAGQIPLPSEARRLAAHVRELRDQTEYGPKGVDINKSDKNDLQKFVSEDEALKKALGSQPQAVLRLFYKAQTILQALQEVERQRLAQKCQAQADLLSKANKSGGTAERTARLELEQIQRELKESEDIWNSRRTQLHAMFGAALSDIDFGPTAPAGITDIPHKFASAINELKYASATGNLTIPGNITKFENVLQIVRDQMTDLHKADELNIANEINVAMQRDWENSKKQHPIRNKLLLGLLAMTLSGGIAYETNTEADILRERIEQIKQKKNNQAEARRLPDKRIKLTHPQAYIPSTGSGGGNAGEALPLNIHPDSALTLRKDDKGMVWRAGIYKVKADAFEPIILPVATKLAGERALHDVTLEPMGSGEIIVPLAPGTALNPKFSYPGVQVEQYLSHILVRLDSHLIQEKIIRLPGLVTELHNTDKLVTTADIQATGACASYSNAALENPASVYQALEPKLPKFVSPAEARERFTALTKLYHDLHSIWAERKLTAPIKHAQAMRAVQEFLQSPLFLYNASQEQQEIDMAVMKFFDLPDQNQVHLITGKLDCDRAVKFALDILHTSRAQAIAEGLTSENESLPMVAVTGLIKKPTRWTLIQLAPNQPKMGNIDGENSGHGIAALMQVTPEGEVALDYYDMTPAIIDPDYHHFTEQGESYWLKEQETKLEAALTSPILLSSKLPSSPEEAIAYKNALDTLNSELENYIFLSRDRTAKLYSLPDKTQIKLLEIADAQLRLLSDIAKACRPDDTSAAYQSQALVNLSVLHKIATGLRPEAYTALEPTIIKTLQAKAVVPLYLWQRPELNRSEAWKCDDYLISLLKTEWPAYGENSRDVFYRERDEAIRQAFAYVDSHEQDMGKKLLLFNQYYAKLRQHAPESRAAEWLEDKLFELFHHATIDNINLPDLYKEFIFSYNYNYQYFSRARGCSLTPEHMKQLNREKLQRLLKYSQTALQLFPLGEQTSNASLKQAASKIFNQDYTPGSYTTPVVVDLTQKSLPKAWHRALIGPEILSEDNLQCILKPDNAGLHTQFTELAPQEQTAVVNAVLATALKGTADDVARARINGTKRFYQFAPLNTEAKVYGTQYYELQAVPEQAMRTLKDFFASQSGRRYLEERYDRFMPVSENNDFVQYPQFASQTKGNKAHRNIDDEFATNMVDEAVQKFIPKEEHDKIDGLVRSYLVNLVTEQVIKVKQNLAGRAERNRPARDW